MRFRCAGALLCAQSQRQHTTHMRAPPSAWVQAPSRSQAAARVMVRGLLVVALVLVVALEGALAQRQGQQQEAGKQAEHTTVGFVVVLVEIVAVDTEVVAVVAVDIAVAADIGAVAAVAGTLVVAVVRTRLVETEEAERFEGSCIVAQIEAQIRLTEAQLPTDPAGQAVELALLTKERY